MLRRVVRYTMLPAGLCQGRAGSTKSKTIAAADAANLVRSNDTITVSGFVAQSPPEEILKALGARFDRDKSPKDLTLLFYGGPGDWDKKGLNHLAQPGMLRRTIGSHYGQTPLIGQMALRNEIEAYNLPMGTVARMMRATASRQPGYMTRVGLGTMADPRQGGGRINDVTKDDLAQFMTINGEEHLFYKALPVHVAIIRGTTADPNGNVTMERESLYCDCLNQAMAARSSGGLVVCQVERIAANDSLSPRQVRIPGTLVDAVVVAEPGNHPMSFFCNYHPGWSAEVRTPPPKTPMPLDVRKVVARRAALQLLPNQVVNLGIGMPEGVASVADEEHVLKYVSLTTEPGTHGGVGASGHNFGPAVNYDGMVELNQQFDFYNGGGLDACFLGMAQVNPKGDVNVTRVGKTLTGPGGFIDISQCTKRVNLMGTFTAGGLEVAMEDGKLRIVKEGKVKKFVEKIPETTFSGHQALSNQQIVNYITERCVFALTNDGLELAEVAPGIDIERDILAHMEFTPLMKHKPREMNPIIFKDAPMGMKARLFSINMANRLHYDSESNTLFIDVSTCAVRTLEDVKYMTDYVRHFFENKIMRRAHVEANYDGFEAIAEVKDAFNTEVALLEREWYLSVRRHVGRTFRHAKRTKLAASSKELADDLVDIDYVIQYVDNHAFARIDRETLANTFARRDSDSDGKLSREEFSVLLQKLAKYHQ